MPLSRGLSLWLYPAAIGSTPPQSLRDYRSIAKNLTFTTVSPGGYGTLTVTLNLTAKHLARPELQLFARVALMARGEAIFLGEISDLTLSASGSFETIQLTALGVGNCLRDDPSNWSYTAQTGYQIINDQFNVGGAGRQNYNMPISFDMSQVFPDLPATQYTLSYAWRTTEEIVQDVTTLAGPYAWGVWEHPTSVDLFGFRLGRLYVHAKDTTTTTYIASLLQKEVTGYSVAQSSERAYNVIVVGYNTPASGAPSFSTATDARLAGSGAIGNAPFRRRSYNRDLAGNSVASSANAQTVANTVLSAYKSGGNKVELTLRQVRNKDGAQVPLYSVRADGNIYVPELGGRGNQAPLAAQAGVNQFYIVKTSYAEADDGATLTVTCDNYSNDSDRVMAWLQYAAERQARIGARMTEEVQSLGAVTKGLATGSFVATAGSQNYTLNNTAFRPTLAQAPSSITWAAPSAQVNNTGPGVNSLSVWGFNAFVTSVASGAGSYVGNFTTVGNCVYDVDAAAGTFTHHCEACNQTRVGLRLKRDVTVLRDVAGTPAMSVRCPCGAVECFNLDLGLLRERVGLQCDAGAYYHNSTQGAEQARHIRAMMRHPHVGLHAYVRDCDCVGCAGEEILTGGGVEGGGAGDGAPVEDAREVDLKGKRRAARRRKDPAATHPSAGV